MSDQYVAEGIVFFRSQDVKPFRLDTAGAKRVSPTFADTLRKSELRSGDVVVVRTGYPGTAAVVPDRLSGSNCADLVIITPGSGLDPTWLAAMFNSSFGRGLVGGRLVGSAQQHFNVAAAKELMLDVPPVERQRAAGAVVAATNDLIENSRRRIEILEGMARLLYREWFVHFRFPGHEDVELVDSELGPIPEGWEVMPTGDVFEAVGGGTPSKKVDDYWDDGSIEWFTPSDLTKAGQMFASSSGLKINEVGLSKSSAKLFPVGSVMLTSRATIGVIAIATTEATTNQGFITCVPNERVTTEFLYYWLDDHVERFLQLAGGATFKELRKSTFRELRMVVPSGPDMAGFTSAVSPALSLASNLIKQNRVLREARDLLLPRLISGELDVSELDLDGVPA